LIALLQEIQLDLFSFNSELATMPGYEIAIDRIQDRDVEKLEYEIDRCDRELPALTSFILPGGSPMASSLQLARSVCRRAERAVVRLALSDQLRPVLLRYLNRLSDLLFSLGRLANYRDQHPEVLISTLRQQRIAHSNFDKHRDDF
jgi:cob(I)alamin adenosyltransferase